MPSEGRTLGSDPRLRPQLGWSLEWPHLIPIWVLARWGEAQGLALSVGMITVQLALTAERNGPHLPMCVSRVIERRVVASSSVVGTWLAADRALSSPCMAGASGLGRPG